MSKKNFVMFVGIPASGKSTVIQDFLIGMGFPDVFIYSSDAYIEEKAKELNSTYTEVFSKFVKEARVEMDKKLKKSIEEGKHIFWDQTNLGKKKRASALSQIPNDYYKICVYFTVPETEEELKEHQRRLDSRKDKFIPSHVIKDMIDTYVYPTKGEGFDVIYEFDFMSGSAKQ